MLKKCQWCGKVFEAKSGSARFCCDAHRVAHHRAKKNGVRLKPEVAAPERIKFNVTEDDVARCVSEIRASCAQLDCAAKRGPVRLRELCGFVSGSIVALLEDVGL